MASPDDLSQEKPMRDQQAVLRRMRDLSDAALDRAYLDYQVEANARSAAPYQTGERLPDRDVAGNARATLPIVQAHRSIAGATRAEPVDPIAE